MENEYDIIGGMVQMTQALEKLAGNQEAFNNAHAAFAEKDSAKFNDALGKAGIAEYCHLICRFFCRKHCGGRCLKFCPKPNRDEVDVKEILAFTQAITPLLKNEVTVKWLLDITEAENIDEWNRFLKENKLEAFCYQLCILLCAWQCKKKCYDLCPPNPLITNVGNIPVSQINALGYGNGKSVPSGYVSLPNPAAGYGDHPFGGGIIIKGIFNMPTAVEYLVEVSSTGPGGPYTPIIEPQVGDDYFPLQIPLPVPPDAPFPGPGWNGIVYERGRSQSTGADPGWFKVDQLCDSDGGRLAIGEKQLMQWSSSMLNGTPTTDGVYYLRLRVRDGVTTRVSSPQVLRLDNTGPFPLPRPTISLQLQKPDGTLVPLKCGKVHKGDGLILVTIQAYDPNMSSVSVTARGNSGLSVPVVSTTAVPLSKTYNGNIADQGYVVPTQFLWDPWNDPNIVPCCYLVYVEINDRTIIGNRYDGGHYNAGWEAIEIGF
jgi:hypothetical protein